MFCWHRGSVGCVGRWFVGIFEIDRSVVVGSMVGSRSISLGGGSLRPSGDLVGVWVHVGV